MTTLTASVAQTGHDIPEEIDAKNFQCSDLQDPFSVNRSETKEAEPLPPATVKMVQSLVGLLLLAVLVGEYKKHSDRGLMKPLVQTRIYVEASCRHLASLGITDHPVFGLFDNIIIYYSGHGSYYEFPAEEEEEEGSESIEALCPIDRDTPGGDGKPVPDISDRELNTIQSLISRKKGHRITVILDCCHSGSLSRSIPQPGVRRLPRRHGPLFEICSSLGTGL